MPRNYNCHNGPCQRTAEEVGAPLRVCGGCQQAHYCCSKCQKEDWVRHKAMCQRNQVSLQIVSGVGALENTILPAKLMDDLKKWASKHISWLSNTVIQALNLKKDRTRYLTHNVIVSLKVHITGEPRYQFSLRDAREMDHPEIEDMATQTKTRDLLRQCIEDVATRDEGRQTKGAINTFVIIWCHPVLTTCPISIKHMAVDNDEWLPDWKDRMGSWLKIPMGTFDQKVLDDLEEWWHRQRPLRTFCAVNAFDLKDNMNTPTKCLDFDIMVHPQVKGFHRFSVLEVNPISHEDLQKRIGTRMPQMSKQLVKFRIDSKATTNRNGKKGICVLCYPSLVGISLPAGRLYFFPEEEILRTEVLEHWQNHKYKYIVPIPKHEQGPSINQKSIASS